jgi:hypothetical protein
MGEIIEKTEPRMGYMIDQQDKRYEGELQLKRVNGTITHTTVKIADEKFKLDIQDIKKYDVLLTAAEWTKDGTKMHKQDGRNVTPGSARLKSELGCI